MVKKRNIALAVFLSVITLGIYPLVVKCVIGNQVNKICQGDGKHQMHYLLAVLLGFVTLWIYPVLWCCKAMNRMQDNAYRYGNTIHPAHSGSSYVLWSYLGLFIAIGPIVAFCKLVDDMNAFADIIGYIQPLPYTENKVERITIAESKGVNPLNILDKNNNQKNTVPQIPEKAIPESVKVDTIPVTRPAQGYHPVNKQGSVTCVSGMYEGIAFPIQDNEEMLIGTNPSLCNIVLNTNCNYVSGKHCSIKYSAQNDTYVVVDYSTNGTYTKEDVRLQANSPKTLCKGETICLGDWKNSFKLG